MGVCHSGPCALLASIASQDLLERVHESGQFTVSAVKLNGETVEIGCLHPADAFTTLVTKVERAFGAPANCVQICSGERLLTEGCYGNTLAELGIGRMAQINCVFRDPGRVRLLAQIRNGDQKCQYVAMRALIELGLAQSEVYDVAMFLDRIIHGAHWWKSCESGREEVVMYAQTAQALGELGEEAAPTIPLLRRHARDSHVSQVAADAMGQMGEAGIKALGEMALLSFHTPSIAAARSLRQLGPEAAPAKAELEEAASSIDREVQCAALDALQAISQAQVAKSQCHSSLKS